MDQQEQEELDRLLAGWADRSQARGELYSAHLRKSLAKASVKDVVTDWLTPEQAAARLQISRRSLERLMEDTPASVKQPWRKIGRKCSPQPVPLTA